MERWDRRNCHVRTVLMINTSGYCEVIFDPFFFFFLCPVGQCLSLSSPPHPSLSLLSLLSLIVTFTVFYYKRLKNQELYSPEEPEPAGNWNRNITLVSFNFSIFQCKNYLAKVVNILLLLNRCLLLSEHLNNSLQRTTHHDHELLPHSSFRDGAPPHGLRPGS